MKLLKKTLALLLVVVMTMAILAVPASAASMYWRDEFSTFKQISINTGRSQPGYTSAFQTFLWFYSDNYYDLMRANGGIDGSFGPTTSAIAKDYQGKKGLKVDGYVGPNTWRAVAGDMSDNLLVATDGVTYCFFKIGSTHIMRANNSAPHHFHYYSYGQYGDISLIEFHN